MRKDFIFDFETFGQDATKCAVINVSYFTFDWENFEKLPYTLSQLLRPKGIQTVKFNVKDQVERFNYKIEKSSLDFWGKLPADVRAQTRPGPADVTIEQFFDTMLDYLLQNKSKYWWTRSNTFDPIILWRMANSIGRYDDMNEYLKFWLVRDVRTYIDAKFNFTTRNGFSPYQDEAAWSRVFREHDSRYDVAADILRLQTIYRAENGLNPIHPDHPDIDIPF